MTFNYVVTDAAKASFQKIYEYISNNLYNTDAADKLTCMFEAAIDKACSFPKSNPTYKCYRKIVVENYLVFYRIHEETKTLVIMHVLYGAMDYEKNL